MAVIIKFQFHKIKKFQLRLKFVVFFFLLQTLISSQHVIQTLNSAQHCTHWTLTFHSDTELIQNTDISQTLHSRQWHQPGSIPLTNEISQTFHSHGHFIHSVVSAWSLSQLCRLLLKKPVTVFILINTPFLIIPTPLCFCGNECGKITPKLILGIKYI